jgi:NTE family protein
LRSLLKQEIDFDRLPAQLRSGCLRAVALSATNYQTGTAITFFESSVPIEPWARSTRLGRPEMLTADHVMASAAMPLFFPPVQLGGAFYGDGCVRLTAPLSPAIHLGADKLFAISVRHVRTGAQTADENKQAHPPDLTLAEISGVLMNAVFLDAVEADLERLERINRTLSLIPSQRLRDVPHALRTLPALVLRPSVDLATLASQQHGRLPAGLRYLLSGLGVGVDRGMDLLSYLAFERAYIAKLIELGEADTLSRSAEIRAFMA